MALLKRPIELERRGRAVQSSVFGFVTRTQRVITTQIELHGSKRNLKETSGRTHMEVNGLEVDGSDWSTP
jgi:hypothetical protein